ncbi:hypothetical protein [Streptomyces sp. CB01635]|uniref:hypothetical protein n=1 Tax=unclassified Streptomyces TaxID=2593676 RepID=UPI001F203EE5|nr:hypothetical protein [Streptomyces sp. CB01635]
MVSFSVGGTVSVETTGRPLRFTPRFDLPGQQLIIAGYADAREREKQLADTFGSMQWLWSENDFLRFDRDSRGLCSATFFLPLRSAPYEAGHGAAALPPSESAGLRANEPSEFELPQAAVFRCAPDGAELVCLRAADLLARQPDARIGIAPDVELLVHDGALTGWRLIDPARCLTSGFSTPDTDSPPSPTTRRHLAECLRLVSAPVVDSVMEQDADAWRDLLALQRAVRDQHDDRRRADVVQAVIDRLVDDNE